MIKRELPALAKTYSELSGKPAKPEKTSPKSEKVSEPKEQFSQVATEIKKNEGDYSACTDLQTLKNFVDEAIKTGTVAFDTETDSLNTLEILDKVETYNINHDPIMPFFPIPESFGTEDDIRRKYSEEDLFREFTSDENGENQLPVEEGQKKIDHLGGYEKLYRIKFEAEFLGKLAYDGAKRLYGDPLSKDVDDRIRFELHIMKTMGFPGYFLIVHNTSTIQCRPQQWHDQ